MRELGAFQQSAEAGNNEQMEASALAIFAAAAEDAEKNPTPQLTLKMEAGGCEGRGDWQGAEACYRKVLALEESTGNHGAISKVHYDLSNLFFLLGDLEKADAWARTATAVARQSGIFTLLVMALGQQASCALARSDFAAALEAASEALAVIEPGRVFDRLRAGAWVARARCRMACSDWSGGESDLAASQPILFTSDISPIFAGFHSRAARWWEVTAVARTHKGDLEGACEAWSEAIRIRRHVSGLSHVAGPYTMAALARSLTGSSNALELAGKTDDAKAAAAEAHRIWRELGVGEQPWR